MPSVSVFNMEGEQVGTLELSEAVFGVPVNEAVLHEVVVMQMANRRKGTADTKTRGEVRGGGRKPWRQKGTGRARAGSSRSPIWRGGGIVFGPHPRDYSYKVPAKVRRLALKSALSAKVSGNEVVVLDRLSFEQPRTKDMIRVLEKLSVTGKALVVTAARDENVNRSSRNIPGVKPMEARNVNVCELLKYGKLVITADAVASLEGALGR
ncbi:MAG: 50S ribosomal protein L4 [Peptococcaceae bacterium]|jgi:large subunit ribosomal protein L4|nr:50S ribosomal protein L4 [Peptococcaceae bacterium]